MISRYRTFSILLYGLLIGLLGSATAIAQVPEVSDNDSQAIRQVITAQLAAFRHDDATEAFSYASPAIRAQFGTAERFMSMVRNQYQPVYRPGAIAFGTVEKIHDVITQQVVLLDQEGRSVQAFYPMEQQPDGSWRIAGCYLAPATGQQFL